MIDWDHMLEHHPDLREQVKMVVEVVLVLLLFEHNLMEKNL